MAAEEKGMHPDCPFCGAEETRRAHRRTLELLASFLGFFPFLCTQCGARFTVNAIQEESRRRERLRLRAACKAGACGDTAQDAPRVLVTVQTVGHTEDLRRLLGQLDADRECMAQEDASEPEAPMIILRAPRQSEGGPEQG